MAIVKDSRLRGLLHIDYEFQAEHPQISLQTFPRSAFYPQKRSRSSKGEPHCSKRRSFPAGWWRVAQAQQVIIPGPRISIPTQPLKLLRETNGRDKPVKAWS
jgi:hypothetical protein